MVTGETHWYDDQPLSHQQLAAGVRAEPLPGLGRTFSPALLQTKRSAVCVHAPVTTAGSPHHVHPLAPTAADVMAETLVQLGTCLSSCSPGLPVCWTRHTAHTRDRLLGTDPGSWRHPTTWLLITEIVPAGLGFSVRGLPEPSRALRTRGRGWGQCAGANGDAAGAGMTLQRAT